MMKAELKEKKEYEIVITMSVEDAAHLKCCANWSNGTFSSLGKALVEKLKEIGQ